MSARPLCPIAASCHPSVCCWPEEEAPGDSEPDDCSVVLQADDRCAVQAPPDGCWEPVAALDDCSAAADSSGDYSQRADYSEQAAVPVDCSVVVDSSAGCSQSAGCSEQAPAGYSVPADSSRGDCSEQVDSAPDDCWVAAPDDHSALVVQTNGSPAQVDSAGADLAVDGSAVHSPASLLDGFRADSQRVEVSQALKEPQRSLAEPWLSRVESSLPIVVVRPAVPDAVQGSAVLPQTAVVVAAVLFSQSPDGSQPQQEGQQPDPLYLRERPTPPAEPEQQRLCS